MYVKIFFIFVTFSQNIGGVCSVFQAHVISSHRYSFISTACDFLSAVMNGLICFSVLGVMAHDSGLDLEKTVTSGIILVVCISLTLKNRYLDTF